MAIQTILFDKRESPRAVNGGRGWTRNEARNWLIANGFRAPAGDESVNVNFIRYRQFPPDRCEPDTFRTVTDDVPAGVQLVDCAREDTAA